MACVVNDPNCPIMRCGAPEYCQDGQTLAMPTGHVISTDEKLLRIETAITELDEKVTKLLDWAEALVTGLQAAKESAPLMFRGMIPSIPDL